MRKYTFIIDDELERKLVAFKKLNNIKSTSAVIRECMELVLGGNELFYSVNALDKKINRLLYRENMNKKLLEQLFVNLGFPENEKVKEDEPLKEFYETNNIYGNKMVD